MPIDLPIAHIIVTARQSLLTRLLSPPSLVLRAVQIQCGRDEHLDMFACLQRVEFAVDVEGQRGVGIGGCAYYARYAVVGLVEDCGDFEGFFVERGV